MTARNGQNTMQGKFGIIVKPKKWRKHYHDNVKRRRQIKNWVAQLIVEGKLDGRRDGTQKLNQGVVRKQLCSSNLPPDPLIWEPQHVTLWLRTLSKLHHFTIDCSLFAMNGKGLCLMSLDGFRYRSPDWGAVLHADLRRKLLTQILSVIREKSNGMSYH